jgi:hypothetical protein
MTTRAVTCIYNHIKQHITYEDAQAISFGTILLEHICCKEGRWIKRMKLEAREDLFELGIQAGCEQTWIKGANAIDHTQFLFPIVIGEEDLRAYLCDPIVA